MLHLLVAASLSLGAEGELEITQPRVTFGHLGAPRPKLQGALPGDRVYYSFGIKNLTGNEQGQVQYSIAFEIRDGDGKLIFEQKPFNSIAQNLFGGNVIPSGSYIDVPLDAKPGVTHWKMTVEDRLAKKSVTASGVGKVLPAGFGIVRVGTFADSAGQVPVAAVGVVGTQVFLSFGIVGFGRDTGKSKHPDVKVEFRILDESGKPTFNRPIAGRIKDNIPETLRVIPLQFPLTFDKPGRFTLEITASCQHAGSSAQVSVPVRIFPLE